MDPQVTQLLGDLKRGEAGAADRLLPLVYDEFRRLAGHYLKQERANHTLQATALVHEAYLKLVDQSRADYVDKDHFFAVAAQAMRRILVDHARGKNRAKRGGGQHKVSLDNDLAVTPAFNTDILALDECLQKLQQLDPRQAKVVELRFFGGLTVPETARVLGISPRTVESEWTFARAWLYRELGGHDDDSPAAGPEEKDA